MLGAEAFESAHVLDPVQRSLAQVERATEIIQHLRRFINSSETGRSAEPVTDIISGEAAVSALDRSGAAGAVSRKLIQLNAMGFRRVDRCFF